MKDSVGCIVVGLALTVVLAAGAVSPAVAFDGRREGFVLGFGAGPGVLLPVRNEWDDIAGVFTDLKIGAGLDDRTVLHYSGKQLWGRHNGNPFVDFFPFVALTRYSRAEGPSAFGSIGAGVSLYLESTGSEVGGNGGLSAFVGGGYEFSRHWSVELDVSRTFLEEVPDLYGVSATLNVLAY